MEPVETSRRRPPVTGADALFQTYGDMVYRLAFLRTKSAADAEDVLQEETDVYGAVLQLPQKYRTAIHLYYYEGYSVREIAQMTGSTEPAVKSQLFRARELLREQLKGEFIDV